MITERATNGAGLSHYDYGYSAMKVTARKVRVKASSSKKFEKQALESALLTSKIIHVSSNDFQMTG